ncbi:MAG: MtnX-like HAD-IB family phosphatase [Rhizobiaceae bacterium]|nr:MtnX-like HAD-IB family phosphatase [Rhizobiaceae bacterium]
MQIFCDFDGTISVEDATDLVLSRFADPKWEDIEAQWKQGLIGSAECMRQQIALINATKRDLDSFLDTVSIDPGFRDFLFFCEDRKIPMTIVSDGVDYFIRRILARHGIHGLPIISNTLTCHTVAGRDVYTLLSPFRERDCFSGAGVCKCQVVRDVGQQIYIGDGRSDFCVSDKVDIVLAKSKLAEYCLGQGIPFSRFHDFTDLLPTLKAMLHDMPRPLRAAKYPTIA